MEFLPLSPLQTGSLGPAGWLEIANSKREQRRGLKKKKADYWNVAPGFAPIQQR